MDTLKNTVARFFDTDSSEYLEHKYSSGGDSYMALRKERAQAMLSAHVAPSFNEHFRCLDCGCGPGILQDVIASDPMNYWAMDISEEMLKLARRRSTKGRLVAGQKHLTRGDVESLPFRSASFDAAASLGVIEYLEGDDKLLAEMARIVRPDGYVLIAVTNKYAYNLWLERPLNWLRRNGLAVKILNAIKVGLKMGQFRRADFEKRRHAPQEFANRLGRHGLTIVETVSWGFNFLPHPLHHACGGRLNRWANAFYDKSKRSGIKLLGEGYMVLCRRTGDDSLTGPVAGAGVARGVLR
jgi:ubiquinone/menaquinone biosynthesis C-methylase UbiE